MPEQHEQHEPDPDPDAMELQGIHTQDRCESYDDGDEYAQSAATVSSGENRVPYRTVAARVVNADGRGNGSNCGNGNDDDCGGKGVLVKGKKIWDAVSGFWTSHVVLVLPQKKNRDHYALERTFLAYIRTSVILAMQGVLIAQLFRLQRSKSQRASELTYYEVAIPLSIACHCVALVVVAVGAFRFWRQQNALFRGKVHAGGWELNSIGVLVFSVLFVTLVLSVVILVQLDRGPPA